MNRENDLGRDDIKKLVPRIAIPSMLAQFVSVLYSIVDRMYIGNIQGIGDIALAGVGVCGPIVTMVGSVAFLIGIGGSPLMSMRMGEGRMDEAKKILANCFLILCVFSVALIIIVIPLREPMLRLFGASDATYPYAEKYFTVYLYGTVFALLATGLNQFIITQGYAKTGMLLIMLGAVTNIVLDPIFIFVFDMSVEGAAAATVASQAISAVFALCFLLSKRAKVRLSIGGYQIKTIRRVLTLGFTPFIIIALDNVMIIAMNAVLQHYGGPITGDSLITAATIAQSFMLVVTMPLGGITGGTQTILAFNYGAKQIDRVLNAQRHIIKLCLIYVTFMFIAARLAGPLFVRLFTNDEQLSALAFHAIKICTLAIIPLGVQYELVDGFTALGQVRYAFGLSFFRKFTYFLALFIFPALWGAEAAFYAETVSDIMGPLLTIIVYLFSIKKILNRRMLGAGAGK